MRLAMAGGARHGETWLETVLWCSLPGFQDNIQALVEKLKKLYPLIARCSRSHQLRMMGRKNGRKPRDTLRYSGSPPIVPPRGAGAGNSSHPKAGLETAPPDGGPLSRRKPGQGRGERPCRGLDEPEELEVSPGRCPSPPSQPQAGQETAGFGKKIRAGIR